jgi:hypothetical protein
MDVHHHVVTIDQPPPVKPQNGSLSSSTTSWNLIKM